MAKGNTRPLSPSQLQADLDAFAELIVLLAGGDKRSQSRDIQNAIEIAKEL